MLHMSMPEGGERRMRERGRGREVKIRWFIKHTDTSHTHIPTHTHTRTHTDTHRHTDTHAPAMG